MYLPYLITPLYVHIAILKRRIEMQDDFQIKRKNLKYCCAAKQYHSNDAWTSENTLKILPRVITFKKCFRTRNSYDSTVNLFNNGLYKRMIDVITDSSDTTVHVCPKELENNFLLPNQSLQISVRIEPKTKFGVNRRRHVFITSQHPNVTFSIPIIILAGSDDENGISLPLSITFPPTTVDSFSYYRMIVYNKSDKKLQFAMKCPFSNLTVQTNSPNIRRNHYAEILLKLYCSDLKSIENSLRLQFSTGDKYDVTFEHEPLHWSMFVDTLSINFELARFKRRETREFLICNDSNKNIVFDINFISQEEADKDFAENFNNSTSDIVDIKANENVDKFSYKHFAFEPTCGTINVKSSCAVKISFCPVMHEDFLPKENEFSPFSVIAGVSISAKNELSAVTRKVCLRGEIIGPVIEILPDVLNISDIYFGEEQLVEFTVQNKDDLCDAIVNLCGVSNLDNAHIIATPRCGLFLKPNQRDVFRLQFYLTMIGRFLIKLELKVKRGAKYSIILTGYSKPVRVKSFPENINLGIIPIAIPQKHSVLLLNPLTTPITVQCGVSGDGNETPLALNVHDTEEHLPFTVKDPLVQLKQSYEYNQEICHDFLQVGEEFNLIYDDREEEYEKTLLSFRSQSADNTSCSTEFAVSALDHIPDMSCQLVSHLKSIDVLHKSEVEKRVVEETLNVLLKTPYFCDMDKCKNYTQMDWKSLPTDPQEIYCNTEIIYLKPRTGKAISVVVVPNVLGPRVKHLELRVCPLIQSTDTAECLATTNINYSQIIKTEILSSKLRIEYNCSVPEILWNNVIIMKDQLYAGEFYDFQMEFRNSSQFGGFFYYDVVPQLNLGTLNFPNKTWKYFIEPGSKISVPCQVKFTKLGLIKLFGCIKFVGVCASHPFHIEAEVFPPRVNIFPRNICKTLPVLEPLKLRVFIENATPTSTWFHLKLKDESCMSFEPRGSQLGPNGQATYVSLNARFQDPGIYKNILYLILEFEIVEKIPITINVRGIPIFIQPEIRGKDLNVGCLLCDSEEKNSYVEQNFSKVIKVINKGMRSYRLSITRTKSSPKCYTAISLSKAKITIKPNNLIIPALSEASFNILLNSTEATSFYNEFRLQITAENSVKHMESSRFTLSGEFAIPELSWNRREIIMEYQRTENCNEWEIVRLTNTLENCVENVKLKVSGPFKIKALFEHQHENELKFSMKGFESKEFSIALDEEMLTSSSTNRQFDEGCIFCSANLRVQKSIRLRVLVYTPKVTLKQNQIILFSGGDESRTYVEMTNSGQIPATYKWKKLKEELRYISKYQQEEDTGQVVSMVLSNLLDMVEQKIIRADFESETNMFRRCEKYKCILVEPNDPLNLKEVLYEIIQNLDLNAKRYKMSYQDPVEILDHLKLDESCDIFSTPSSENCEIKSSVYFIEKCGQLQEAQKAVCALHIPPIRKGFEVRALFRLDVAGGESQQLEIVLVNLNKPINISKQKIYLGLKPWYERYRTTSNIENATDYQLCLKLQTSPTISKHKLPKIALGLCNIVSNKTVQLAPFQNTIIRIEGTMGFTEDFKRTLNVIVNDSTESAIEIYGHGAMSMLTVVKPFLPLFDQQSDEVYEEYHLLQKIYHSEIFKTFTDQKEDFVCAMPEEENDLQEVHSFLTNFTMSSNISDYGSETPLHFVETNQNFLKLMRTYVFVSQNEDLPNYKLLHQLVETEKFLSRLRLDPETSALLHLLHHNYLLHFKSYDEHLNLKHFNVQSLPFHLRPHVLDMGQVYLNQFCKIAITLDFYGPGKLIAAASTTVKISGLMIDFQVFENLENLKFTYYRAEDTSAKNSCDKPYRNINERILDKETSPKVRHAHSYDFNALHQHQRTVKHEHNSCLKRNYSSLDKSLYMERKHQFTYCKIAGNKKYFNAANINLILLFRPQRTHFGHNQTLEDYLFIDLHLGTTLPILLRALIIDPKRKDTS